MILLVFCLLHFQTPCTVNSLFTGLGSDLLPYKLYIPGDVVHLCSGLQLLAITHCLHYQGVLRSRAVLSVCAHRSLLTFELMFTRITDRVDRGRRALKSTLS